LDLGSWDLGGWDLGGWDLGGWDLGGCDLDSHLAVSPYQLLRNLMACFVRASASWFQFSGGSVTVRCQFSISTVSTQDHLPVIGLRAGLQCPVTNVETLLVIGMNEIDALN